MCDIIRIWRGTAPLQLMSGVASTLHVDVSLLRGYFPRNYGKYITVMHISMPLVWVFDPHQQCTLILVVELDIACYI